MSEGRLTPPVVEPPELVEDAQLIVVSGPMRCGKTTVALEYAWQLDEAGMNVMAYRPEQDARHHRDQIESQSGSVEPYPANRVQNIGNLAVYGFRRDDVLFLDEPFMWSEEGDVAQPHKDSIRAVERAISFGATVLVSTLDKSYMEQNFAWYEELLAIGAATNMSSELGRFQHVPLVGVCELCPGDEPDDWRSSVSTNLYLNGQKQQAGAAVIPEADIEQQVYVPCCEGCRDDVAELDAAYTPRFSTIEV